MKRLAILILIIFISSGALCDSEQIQSSDQLQLHDREDYLIIYLNAINMLSPALTLDYKINTDEDQRKILQEADASIKKMEAMQEPFIPPEDLERRFDRVVIPQLYHYFLQPSVTPYEEDVKDYYENNKDDFMQPESFFGARFLIPKGPDMKKKAAEWKKKLQESDLPFLNISEQYYHSIGEKKTGVIGRIYKGRIRDELFDAFMSADVKAPWFGPVETKYGLMFGKVYKKFPPEPRPFDQLKDKLRVELAAKRKEERLNALLLEAREKGVLERVYDKDDFPRPDDVLYRIYGREVTWKDVLENHPYMTGRPGSMEYFRSMMKRGMIDDYVFFGENGADVKETPEYRYMKKAFVSQLPVLEGYMEKIEEIDFTHKDLKKFYEENKDEKYAKEPYVRLIFFSAEKNPDKSEDPVEKIKARARAWKTINAIRADFTDAPEKTSYKIPRELESQGVRMDIFSEPRSVFELDREVALSLKGKAEGYTGPVMEEGGQYLFCHLLEWKEGGIYPFDEMLERVERDYLHAKRTKALETLRGARDGR